MKHFIALAIFCSLATQLPTPAAASPTDISGKWGDATGRIGCAKDNEYLTFDKAGTMTIPEGAKLAYVREGEDLRLQVAKEDVLTLRILSTDKMDLVKFERGGKVNPKQLDAWKNRHGAFVRCQK